MSKLNELCELFDPDVRNVISRAFRFIDLAEEEIAAGKARYPRSKKRVNATFILMDPGELIRFGEELFRAHCREIIERAVRGQDTRLGTKAEVVAAISTMSLSSRLHREVEELGLALTAELFPEHADLAEDVAHRGWDLAERESVLVNMCRKLSVEKRVLQTVRRVA